MQQTALFDHLVGSNHQRRRNIEAKRLGGPQVDHQLELRGLLDRKVGWLRTLEDTLNVGGSPTIQVDVVRAIRNQCPILRRWWERIYRRQAVTHRSIDDPAPV